MNDKQKDFDEFIDDGVSGNAIVECKHTEEPESPSDAKQQRAMIWIIASLVLAVLAICGVLLEMVAESGCRCSGNSECWCGFGVVVLTFFVAPIPMIIGTILAVVGVTKLIKSKRQGVVVQGSQIVCGVIAILQIPILAIIFAIYLLLHNLYM